MVSFIFPKVLKGLFFRFWRSGQIFLFLIRENAAARVVMQESIKIRGITLTMKFGKYRQPRLRQNNNHTDWDNLRQGRTSMNRKFSFPSPTATSYVVIWPKMKRMEFSLFVCSLKNRSTIITIHSLWKSNSSLLVRIAKCRK